MPTMTRLDVRAVPITQAVGKLAGAHHLFIVWTAVDGTELFLRGGPGNPVLGPVDEDSLGFGGIRCTWGPYVPRSVDYSLSALSVTAAVGYRPEAYQRMVQACEAINWLGRAYRAMGPNSNTVARTLLSVLGVPLKKPDVYAPGWELASLLR